MADIGGIVGGALNLVGSIAGGIAASREARKREKRLQEAERENQDWYDRRYNEDATQRADAQRLITLTEEAIKKRNKAAQGTAAVMGGSTESVAAEKLANNEILADTVSQIAADAADRKDQIEQQYMARKDDLMRQKNELSAQKAQNISTAISGVASAAGSIAGGLDWKKQ
jgi:hypothetical protein